MPKRIRSRRKQSRSKTRPRPCILQSEKTLSDIGDKLPESDKTEVKAAVEKLKETCKNGSTEQIKEDTDALEKAFYALSEKLYKQYAAHSPVREATADNGSSEGQNGGTTDGNGNYYSQDFEDKT